MSPTPRLVVLVAAGAFASAACADGGPIDIDSTSDPGGLVAHNTSSAPPSATGSGHTLSGGEPRTFAFSAVSHGDGSASGNYVIVIHAIDAHIMVDVTCMRVLGDKAWVAGIIRKTNHPVVREGTVSYFWTVDGGEGRGAVDIVSTARINDAAGEDQRFCSLMPDEQTSGLPGNAVLGGNVQVRGGG
jgi:hypothetical protein